MRIRGTIFLCALICATAFVWHSRQTRVEGIVLTPARSAVTASEENGLSDPALATTTPRGAGELRLDASTDEREALNEEPEAEAEGRVAQDGCLLEVFDALTGKPIDGRLSVSAAGAGNKKRVRLVSGKRPPIVLSREHAGKTLEVLRMGYARLEASFAPEAERLRVDLLRKRKLKVELAAENAEDRDFEISTLGSNGKVIGKRTCRSSGRVSFALGAEREIRLRVALMMELGGDIPILERDVVLNLDRDTQNRIELPEDSTTGKMASLTVRLTFADPIELDYDWRVMLRFSDDEALQPIRAIRETPNSRTFNFNNSEFSSYEKIYLEEFDELDPKLAYELSYASVRPGKYQVLLLPLGIRREMVIEAGDRAACLLDLPQLARVLVRPVMEDGTPHDEDCTCGLKASRPGEAPIANLVGETSHLRISRIWSLEEESAELRRIGALWDFPWEPGVPLELSLGNEGISHADSVSSHAFDPITVTPRGERFVVDLVVREE